MSLHRWSPTCPPPRGLVRPVPVDPTGRRGPTRGQAAGPRWRRTTRGLYVPADTDSHRPEQRVLEQSMRLPPGGAVTGWASLRMHQATFFDGLLPDGTTRRPVPLALPGPARLVPSREFTATRGTVEPAEVVVRAGVPCTVPIRAVFDEMRSARGVREAVVALDMAVAAGLVSVRQVVEYVEGRAGWTGVQQVRRALPLAEEDSRSPNETRMRLVWQLDAGLPRPLCNQPVFTRDGRLVGYPDLLDVEAGVVGEYDGADHRGARRHSRDVLREEDFRRLGLEYFKVTGPDLAHTDRIVRRMLSTRERAQWLPPEGRRWTLEPPSWFRSRPSLLAQPDGPDVEAELRAIIEEAEASAELP